MMSLDSVCSSIGAHLNMIMLLLKKRKQNNFSHAIIVTITGERED